MIRLTNAAYWRTPGSSTFHGRDIMSSVVGNLLAGSSIDDLGPPTTELKPLSWPQVVQNSSQIIGEVVTVDSFGNLLTNLRAEWLPSNYEELQTIITADGTGVSLPFVTTFANGLPGRAVSLVGSSGWVEVAVVNGHAKNHMKAAVGDRVVVSWRN